jgi:glycosyltransferase involved in cell wall biosynthesis
MRILTTLTYYTPHVSGLTVYARRVVRRLVEREHQVTVLTSRYNRSLPSRETIDGATVVRSPVLLQVSKGVLMPLFIWHALRLIRAHDVVYIHLPQFEGSIVALLAKVMRRPVITAYQCDIELPPGFVRFIFTPAIRLSHYVTGKLSDRIVVTSEDYGRSARLPRRFHQKVLVLYPPAELAGGAAGGAAFRHRHGFGESPLVGFVGRFAEEKGIEYLLESVPRVLTHLPATRYVFAGPTDTVPGEQVHQRLRQTIQTLGDAVVHLGLLSEGELAELYGALDVLVLPSTNSTEAFGMTQVEAMLAGTPVVASDIPGVREAVRVTGMGRVVPPRDPAAIAAATLEVLEHRDRYVRPRAEIQRLFDPHRAAAFYEELFEQLLARRRRPQPEVPTGDVAEPGESEPARR